MNAVLPALAIVLPLAVAAVVAALARSVPRRLVEAVAIATAVATAVLCAIVLERSRDATLVTWMGAWHPRQGVALGIALAVDPIGAGLAVLSSVLITAALIYAVGYFEDAEPQFQVLMLVFLGALCGFSLTGDLFNLFVFFELMSVAGFALAGLKIEEPSALQGAINFAVLNTIGAFLILIGIGLLYGRTGALNMAQIGRALSTHADPLVAVAFALLASGLLVKAAIFPFHFWLADTHAVAPTPACVVFSGVMVEVALYAVARIASVIFRRPLLAEEGVLRTLLVGLGLLTGVVGGVMCFAQQHLKRLLAFSTIAHAGVVLAALGLQNERATAGAALYVLGHGLVKGGLFLVAGMILHRLRSVDEVALRGRGRGLVPLGVLFGIGGLLLSGMPPFAGFLGQALMDAGAREAGHAWLSTALMLVPVITGAAVLRATARIFLGWGPRRKEAPGGGERSEQPETPATDRTPLTMWIPAAVLVTAAFVLGFVTPLVHGALVAAHRFADASGYWLHVLDGVTAIAPASTSIPPLAPAVLRGSVSVVLAVALAGGVLLRDRLPQPVRRTFGAMWNPGIEWLRRRHTGRVGDYAAWLTVGVGFIAAWCTLLLR